MQKGYIPDRAFAGYYPSKWFEGDLVTNCTGRTGKSKSKPLFVETYRCVQCGCLESYAAKPFS